MAIEVALSISLVSVNCPRRSASRSTDRAHRRVHPLGEFTEPLPIEVGLVEVGKTRGHPLPRLLQYTRRCCRGTCFCPGALTRRLCRRREADLFDKSETSAVSLPGPPQWSRAVSRRSACACGRGGGACIRRRACARPCPGSARTRHPRSRPGTAPISQGVPARTFGTGLRPADGGPAQTWPVTHKPKLTLVPKQPQFGDQTLPGCTSQASTVPGLQVSASGGKRALSSRGTVSVLSTPAADAFGSSAFAAGRRPSRAITMPVPGANRDQQARRSRLAWRRSPFQGTDRAAKAVGAVTTAPMTISLSRCLKVTRTEMAIFLVHCRLRGGASPPEPGTARRSGRCSATPCQPR